MRTRAMCTTYEYQCRAKILVMLLHEVLVVLFGLLVVMLVEFGTETLLWRPPVLFLSVRGVNDGGRRDTRSSLPIYWMTARFPVSIPLQYPSIILGVMGGQRAVILGFSYSVPRCGILPFPKSWCPNCQGGKRSEQRITYCLPFPPSPVLTGESSSAAWICPSISASRL